MALAVLALFPAMGRAQATTAGGEFRVNTYTQGYQYARANSVGMSADGRFVIVWESPNQDGSAYGSMARRYENNGQTLGAEFTVNSYTTGSQYFSAVSVNRRGRFLVTWQSADQDGSQAGVFGQRYDAAGVRAGAEFRANTYTTAVQSRASVGLDAVGNAVVVWRSAGPTGQDGDVSGIYAQRYDFSGALQGTEFRVNSYTTQYQNRPDVARAADGSFVVAWQSNDQEGYGFGYGIYAQRYNAAGAAQGGEFRVNSYTTSDQGYPSVGIDNSGNFVVAWVDYSTRDGSASSIRAQRFNAAGSAQGGEFQVNSTTSGYQYASQVAMAADGGAFVVAFTSNGVTTNREVRARRFDANGVAVGDDFKVNTNDPGYQYLGGVGADPVGNFVVAWNSDGQDGSNAGVYAQRFGGLVPSALAVDTAGGGSEDGNGVWEPGESVNLNASWRNVNGQSQGFSGLLTNLVGPAATYTIEDGSTNYGTVTNGNVGACTNNCFRVRVNNPTRPQQHWDASVLETITPSAQGQQKRWALHIGQSFSDVPKSNLFYRFIEILLHQGITGGCGGTNYCPSTATTRDQMAVFVLVAKEGVGYAPPACSPPNLFNDVSEANPFCRWIEELATRGVVSGCGNGNYCPSSPVTREQMSIFVLRTLDPALNPPACSGAPMFDDVPNSSPFCKWIEELARRGVVSGCGGSNYCPAQAVTREQMGVFISATFGLTLYGV